MNWKRSLRKIIPRWLSSSYHLLYAWYGAWRYYCPSEEIRVIGVTGTSGKSSTIYFLKQILEYCGFKVGALSTIEFCIAGDCRLNDRKMTMLGKTEIQKSLRQMTDAGCDIALIETTSEGFVQCRHRFINYDAIVLTNLYPEHIESHGSFENYKAAKLGIFEYVAKCRVKKIGREIIPKTCFVNGNSEYASQFLQFPFQQKIVFGKLEIGNQKSEIKTDASYCASNADITREGIKFELDHRIYTALVHGEYNVSNIAAAIAIAKNLNVDVEKIKETVAALKPVPGRLEFIALAEARGLHVIIDYAFEPVAMAELYKVVALYKPKRIIHVFGSTGGGRDVARRFTVGEFVGARADICIVTDEDPYDDDPMEIMNDVAEAARKQGKKDDLNLFIIPDRRKAIGKALSLAVPGDMVLVTGKGSEQAMVVKGELKPWDDREVVRSSLNVIPEHYQYG